VEITGYTSRPGTVHGVRGGKIPKGVTQTTPTITWYDGALYIFVKGTEPYIIALERELDNTLGGQSWVD
jgi:hypothetical protein